jgi:hypothetical protein
MGYRSPDGTSARTLAEHWDGSTWSVVPSPSPGVSESAFFSAAAIGPEDVWAVGIYNDSLTTFRALVEHWDGSRWRWIRLPGGTAAQEVLTSIAGSGPNDVWAVGYLKDGQERTFALHWNGTAWSEVSSGPAGSGDSRFMGVATASSTDIWAVGYRSTSQGDRTLIERWDGSAFTRVPSANPSRTMDRLNAVATAGQNDVWAVGYAGDVPTTLAEHWDGSAWSAVPTPDLGGGSDLFLGVGGGEPDRVWAVGYHQGDSTVTPNGTLIERWDGSTWNVVPSPNGGSASNQLNAVVDLPTGYQFAAGTYVFRKHELALIEQRCGT